MTLYFVTSATEAARIRRDGFSAEERTTGSATVVGVWLSDPPRLNGREVSLDAIPEGFEAIAVHVDRRARSYELVSWGAKHREWCLPVALANAGFRRLATGGAT